MVRIETSEAPEWLTAIVAEDPEADVWVAFKAQPELFSRASKVANHGVEYAGGHGMGCVQPVADIVAYRIGPAGDIVGVRGVTVELIGEEQAGAGREAEEGEEGEVRTDPVFVADNLEAVVERRLAKVRVPLNFILTDGEYEVVGDGVPADAAIVDVYLEQGTSLWVAVLVSPSFEPVALDADIPYLQSAEIRQKAALA